MPWLLLQVIELVKSEILPCSTHAPKEFLRRLTSVLNRGSIHSATDQFDGGWRERERERERERGGGGGREGGGERGRKEGGERGREGGRERTTEMQVLIVC